jgi:gas vesicle protein
MMNRNNKNAFLVGAAVAVGVLGTLTTLLLPKRARKGWGEQAREAANNATDWKAHKRFIGGIAGSLVGVTTALLLAPKSGNDLLEDISKTFQQKGKPSRSAKHKRLPAVIKHQAAANQTQQKSSKGSRTKSKTSGIKRTSAPKGTKSVSSHSHGHSHKAE